jgi:Lsr2
MAQRTQVLYVDDLDGSEAEGTVRFGYDGTDYEIDLNKEHADRLAEAIAPFIAAGRKVSSTRRSARRSRGSRQDTSDVRAWARSQGLKVSERGRIPSDVLAKYEASH